MCHIIGWYFSAENAALWSRQLWLACLASPVEHHTRTAASLSQQPAAHNSQDGIASQFSGGSLSPHHPSLHRYRAIRYLTDTAQIFSRFSCIAGLYQRSHWAKIVPRLFFSLIMWCGCGGDWQSVRSVSRAFHVSWFRSESHLCISQPAKPSSVVLIEWWWDGEKFVDLHFFPVLCEDWNVYSLYLSPNPVHCIGDSYIKPNSLNCAAPDGSLNSELFSDLLNSVLRHHPTLPWLSRGSTRSCRTWAVTLPPSAQQDPWVRTCSTGR